MQIKLGDFLREICIKTVVNNEYPVLTSSKNGIYLQSEYFNKQVASKDNTGYKIIKKGQFTYRAMSDTGEFYPNMLKCVDIGIVSPAYPVFEITNRDIIYPQYLQYFFRSNTFRYNISGLEQGSTRTSIKFNKMKNIKIKLPPLLEQKKVIMILDRVGSLIFKRQEQLKYFDELTKSLFIEMFGDLVKGKYEIKKLKDISKKISDGIHSKPEYTKTGRPFLSVVNINKGKVNFEDCKYVSEESFQKMIKSTHPEKGDILYTKVGATYGIAAYIDTNVEFCLYVSVCLIKPKHYLINAKFLSIQMNMPFIKYQADNRIKGIGVPDLHLNQIREFDIIVPPLDLQNRFADYVSSIDKSKLAVKKSLEELEILKKSLMQKYFA